MSEDGFFALIIGLLVGAFFTGMVVSSVYYLDIESGKMFESNSVIYRCKKVKEGGGE